MEYLLHFKNYLSSKTENASKATVKNYISDVKKFINWFELKRKTSFSPSLVTTEDIHEFKADMAQSASPSSIDRYLSSLKKLFTFISLNGELSKNPFIDTIEVKKEIDNWKLREFKNFLYANDASRLTIKNYIIDLRQFQTWAQNIKGNESLLYSGINSFPKLHSELVNEYSKRLLIEGKLSPVTINRKLSSLRKYLSWARSENFLTDDTPKVPANVDTRLPIEAKIDLIKDKDSNIIRERSYSKIPPVRLFQKLLRLSSLSLDLFFVNPMTYFMSLLSHLIWVMKGKPLFVKKPSPLQTIELKQPEIKNIPKSFFDPLSISVKHFPWYKKLVFHVRHTRPIWYRRYMTSALAGYFNISIILIFFVIVGFGLYTIFFKSVGSKNTALAAIAASPPRILSFQGRLTDKYNQPIIANTSLRFSVYNSSYASGSALLWQEIDTIQPDENGNFSTSLGIHTPLPEGIFNENNELWLGISIGSTRELIPRQELPTVQLANNAQSLQGIPLITQGLSSQNVVLALDNSGNLSIGGTTNFRSTSGQFGVFGTTVVLGTNENSNGNVTIVPSGTGKIDLEKPIQNSSLYNNISSAKGAVEVDDLFAVLSTSSGQSAITIEQDGLGPLISASRSGVSVFTVDSLGNTITAGNITTNTLFTGNDNQFYVNNNNSNLNSLNLTGNLSLAGNVSSSLIPNGTNTFDLGSQENQWNNIYANNIYLNGQSLKGYLQENNNTLSPINANDDLLVGGNTPDTASWQVYATTQGVNTAGTASTEGGLTFTGGTTNINQVNGGSLSFNTSPSGQGDAGLSTKMILTNSGDLAIGTTNAQALLNLSGNGSLQIGQNTDSQFTTLSNNELKFSNSTSSYISQETGGTLRFGIGNLDTSADGVTISPSNFVGIGTTSPNFPLDIQATVSQTVPVGTCYAFLKNSTSPSGQYCGGSSEAVSANFLGSVFTDGEFHSFSDERAKNLLEYLNPSTALSAISELKPLHFQWKPQLGKGSQVIAGFFAQDVASVIPEAVSISNGQYFPNQESLDYNMLVTYAVSALQELNTIQQTQALDLASQSASLSSLNLSNVDTISLNDTTPSTSFSIPHYYTLSDAVGNSINQAGAFLSLAVGNLKAGSIATQNIVTNTLAIATNSITVSGQSLDSYILSVVQHAGFTQSAQSPIAETEQIHTNIISPLSNSSQIAIRLNNSGIEFAKDATSAAVASIDNEGNATFSGTLNSQNLAVNADATIAGTLHVGKIVANSIVGLNTNSSTVSAQNITNVTNIYYATPSSTIADGDLTTGFNQASNQPYTAPTVTGGYDNISSFAAELQSVPTLENGVSTFNQGILALGPSNFSDTSITGTLSIGSQLSIADTSVNVFGGNLQLQPSRSGGIAFESGLINIDQDGNLTVNGNAIFSNTLAANIISPIGNSNLTIQLGNSSATESGTLPQLTVKNASGSSIFAVNQLGDIISSGEATISKLNLNFIQPVLAVSRTEVVASGAAGTAKIYPNETQLTIDDPHVTANSIIYITPVGKSSSAPFLLRQIPSVSFTVGILQSQTKPTTFNWLIVN